MKVARHNILILKQELNKNPIEVAQNDINFLSTLSKDQVKRFDIQDRVVVISWARKVIGKYKMLDTVQDKVDIISHKFKEVIELFTPLVSRGIPFFWEEKGPLLSQQEYLDKLVNCRSDHSKFEDMQQALFGKVMFDKLAEEFELLFDLNSRVPRCLIFHIQTTWNLEFWHMAWFLQICLNLNIGEHVNNMDQLNISYNHEDNAKGVSEKRI